MMINKAAHFLIRCYISYPCHYIRQLQFISAIRFNQLRDIYYSNSVRMTDTAVKIKDAVDGPIAIENPHALMTGRYE